MISQKISEVHPKLMVLQYPLLYSYGEDGFMLEIPYINEGNKEYKRKYVSMLEYYAYYLHYRLGQSMLLLILVVYHCNFGLMFSHALSKTD
jgi:hypothetical protein